jgi:hypothetical protein
VLNTAFGAENADFLACSRAFVALISTKTQNCAQQSRSYHNGNYPEYYQPQKVKLSPAINAGDS